jgi:hypothetical protein
MEIAGITGTYFDEKYRPVNSSKRSYNEDVWRRLCDFSLELTQLDESGDVNREQGVGNKVEA